MMLYLTPLDTSAITKVAADDNSDILSAISKLLSVTQSFVVSG